MPDAADITPAKAPPAWTAKEALQAHWPAYLIEAAGLGIFMLVAGLAGTALEAPHAFLRSAIDAAWLRRVLMGLAMGVTASALVYSPWGKRSGAHFNPALTLAFFSVGKVRAWDALFYIVAQTAGGIVGVLLVQTLCGAAFTDPPVQFIVTVPGRWGCQVALAAECAISFGLMTLVLVSSNRARLARYTGLLCGALIALYVTVEAPLSGMSMNPARTVASALPSAIWRDVWIYLTAPLAGMWLAAWMYQRRTRHNHIACAKLHHDDGLECMFICSYVVHRRRQTFLASPPPPAV